MLVWYRLHIGSCSKVCHMGYCMSAQTMLTRVSDGKDGQTVGVVTSIECDQTRPAYAGPAGFLCPKNSAPLMQVQASRECSPE